MQLSLPIEGSKDCFTRAKIRTEILILVRCFRLVKLRYRMIYGSQLCP